MVKNLKSIFLEKKGKKIKEIFLTLIANDFKFHLGGTTSCLDLMVCLFYGHYVELSKKNRDILILSKGHALGGLLSILIDKNLIKMDTLKKLRNECSLGNQLDIFNLKKYVDWNTGSLGHSLGVSIGLAMSKPNKKIWNIVGDGELDEGSIWEALHFIADKKIRNINIIIDRNRISASSKIENKVFFTKNIFSKLGIHTQTINGHNYSQILNALYNTKKNTMSSIIVANTIKGKGLGFLENNLKYSHHLPHKDIIKSLQKKFSEHE